MTNVDYDVWRDLHQPFLDVANMFEKIGIPTVLVFGIFGNLMIIVIMFRLPASDVSIFFQVLACCDQSSLILGPLMIWFRMYFGVPLIADFGPWPCKVEAMAMYVVGTLSAWMIVALTMQRAAAVLWPHRVSVVWTKSKSRAAAGTVVFVITLIHCHFLYGFDIGLETCGGQCCPAAVSETYGWFFTAVWPWINYSLFSFLPFVLLFVSNIVLVWEVARSASRLRGRQTAQDCRQRKVLSLTVTLITVSITFFILTTPRGLHFIMLEFLTFNNDPILLGQMDVFRIASDILFYSNSAINFYLYCLTGRKFRAEFQNIMTEFFTLLRCKTQKTGSQHRSSQSSAVSAGLAVDTMNRNKRMRAVPDNDF